MPGTPIAATLAPIATWWTVLHVAQVPLFALLGLAVWLLVHDLDGRAARISGGAVAVFVVMVALLAAAWAWRGAGAPWPIVALLAASGLLLGFSHIRPLGPLACGALLVAAGWIESAGARRRAAPRPATL